MSTEAVKWARRQRTGGPAEVAVLLTLAFESDSLGLCSLSTRAVAERVDTDQATARRVLNRLQTRGLVSCMSGVGRAPNTYQLPL